MFSSDLAAQTVDIVCRVSFVNFYFSDIGFNPIHKFCNSNTVQQMGIPNIFDFHGIFYRL